MKSNMVKVMLIGFICLCTVCLTFSIPIRRCTIPCREIKVHSAEVRDVYVTACHLLKVTIIGDPSAVRIHPSKPLDLLCVSPQTTTLGTPKERLWNWSTKRDIATALEISIVLMVLALLLLLGWAAKKFIRRCTRVRRRGLETIPKERAPKCRRHLPRHPKLGLCHSHHRGRLQRGDIIFAPQRASPCRHGTGLRRAYRALAGIDVLFLGCHCQKKQGREKDFSIMNLR
uniref:Uncharacterized protein n=1 Tax=Magallana gigas TaxID=29159 RepID=A0A8W8MPH7_MAGGI